MAVDGHLAADEVDGDGSEGGLGALLVGDNPVDDRRVVHRNHLRGVDARGHATEDGVHAGHQLTQPERLGDVAGRPQLEAEDHVELAVDGTEHDDGDRGDGAHPAADLDTVHPGEEHVEEDDVRWVVGEQAQSLGAVGCRLHGEPLAAEARGESQAVGLLVFDYQHPDALTDGGHEVTTSLSDSRKPR